MNELDQGTFTCDICGQDRPHHHDQQLVEMERLVRPAFEKTIVPCGFFNRLTGAPGSGYADQKTEALWQHFLSGWFACKRLKDQHTHKWEPIAEEHFKCSCGKEIFGMLVVPDGGGER